MMSKTILVVAFLLGFACAEHSTAENPPECVEGDSKTCPQAVVGTQPNCSQSNCPVSGWKPKSFYSNKSGSAQAYKPGAPVKNVVCEESLRKPYRAASWPFSRGGLGDGSPSLVVNVQLLSCAVEDNESCCCSPLESEDVLLEVWQAKPDGSYSSISPHSEEGVCRASVPVIESTASFETLAPGSTGILNGLGPAGWDFSPYGQPTIHLLVTAPGHEPLMAQIPTLMNQKLDFQEFFGPDWRGQAYTLARSNQASLSVDQWDASVSNNQVNIQATVRLHKSTDPSNLHQAMCPSFLYGTPGSFFVEPIALCAPSLLNFFRL